MADSSKFPIVLFDGHCGLCSGVVQTLLRIDKRAMLHFAPLQSAFAKTRLADAGLDPLGTDTIVFFDQQGKAFIKSDAALEIARTIGGVWRLAGVAQVLPKGARDKLYDFVARHRFRVFGQTESCWLPKPEWRRRFLGEA